MDQHAPGAPTTMVMSSSAQWIFTVLHFAIAITTTIWVYRRWDRAEARGELPFAAAAVVLLLSSLNDRRYGYAVPVAIPMVTFAVYGAIAWPAWAALNANASTPVAYLAGTAMVLLALYARQVLAAASVRFVAAGGAEMFWPDGRRGQKRLRSSGTAYKVQGDRHLSASLLGSRSLARGFED